VSGLGVEVYSQLFAAIFFPPTGELTDLALDLAAMGVSRFFSRIYLRCPLAPSAVCTYLCLSQGPSACRMNVHMTWSPLTPSHDGMHVTSSLFTSARSRNRRSSYTSMDFSSLVPSRALKRPPALSSPSPSGCGRQFAFSAQVYARPWC
jgi:hypothetical protein